MHQRGAGESYVDPALAHHVIAVRRRTTPKNRSASASLPARERSANSSRTATRTRKWPNGCSSRSGPSRRIATHHGKLELKTRAELVRFAIDNGLFKLS